MPSAGSQIEYLEGRSRRALPVVLAVNRISYLPAIGILHQPHAFINADEIRRWI